MKRAVRTMLRKRAFFWTSSLVNCSPCIKLRTKQSGEFFSPRLPTKAITFAFSRFRVCQVVAKLLSNAVEANRLVRSRRLDEIQEAMLQRLYDKV